jgi:hypothetical protein
MIVLLLLGIYIYYRVEKVESCKKKRRSKDPFRDFVKDLLKELLDIAMLTYKGEDMRVDGFHFLNSVEVHIDLTPKNCANCN